MNKLLKSGFDLATTFWKPEYVVRNRIDLEVFLALCIAVRECEAGSENLVPPNPPSGFSFSLLHTHLLSSDHHPELISSISIIFRNSNIH